MAAAVAVLLTDGHCVVLCAPPPPAVLTRWIFPVGTGGGLAGRPFPDGGCHVLRALLAVRAQTRAVLPAARAAVPGPAALRVPRPTAEPRGPAAVRVRSSAEPRRPAAGAGQPARRHVREPVGSTAATGVRHQRSVATGRRVGGRARETVAAGRPVFLQQPAAHGRRQVPGPQTLTGETPGRAQLDLTARHVPETLIIYYFSFLYRVSCTSVYRNEIFGFFLYIFLIRIARRTKVPGPPFIPAHCNVQ